MQWPLRCLGFHENCIFKWAQIFRKIKRPAYLKYGISAITLILVMSSKNMHNYGDVRRYKRCTRLRENLQYLEA